MSYNVVLSLSMETEHTGSRTIYIGIVSIDYSSGHMVLQCWDAALLAGSSCDDPQPAFHLVDSGSLPIFLPIVADCMQCMIV